MSSNQNTEIPTSWPEAPCKLIRSTEEHAHGEVPPDHYCRKLARNMAQVHNIIFRSFNAIYTLAPLIEPGTQDATDFLEYAAWMGDVLLNHHLDEDNQLFPSIAKAADNPEIMSENYTQHEVMGVKLDAFLEYVRNTSKDAYNADELRKHMDDLSQPMEVHLHEEIGTLMDLHKRIDTEALGVIGKTDAMQIKKYDQYKLAPFMFLLHDPNFEMDGQKCSFMGAPAFLRYMINVRYAYRYSHLWRFQPFYVDGTPRPVEYFKQVGSGRSLLAQLGL